MNVFEKAMGVMEELFAKDYTFAFATVNNDIPSVRFVDTYFETDSFYIVSYSNTQKVKELVENRNVAMCNELYRFEGLAYNIGHPLEPQNMEIREKLIKVFEPWYFAHNNENDSDMCYIKVELKNGFFYKDGIGYKVNFNTKEVEESTFEFDTTID